MRPEPRVDTQQVCVNGHQITDGIHRRPHLGRKFCPECGKPTITQCPACNAPIPGHVHYQHALVAFSESVPAFCGNRGEPYPWTKARIENFRELTDELDELTEEDRQKLNSSLDELVRESPKAEVASLRFKKILKSLSKGSYELVKKITLEIVSESVKKTIFGP